MKRFTLLFFFLAMIQISYGQTERFHKRISTTANQPVLVGSLDNVFATANPGSYQNTLLNDYLTVGIDHNYLEFLSTAYELEVDIEIIPTGGVAFTTTMGIEFYPFKQQSYKDKDSYVFNGSEGYSFEIKAIRVDGVAVTTLPSNVYIDGEIEVTRAYDFLASASNGVLVNAPNGVNLDCDPNNVEDELELSWGTVQGAVEYQLEWTFVNDYDATISAASPAVVTSLPTNQMPYNFRNNATRITTTNTHYEIPLLFERGYLLYRVRAVGMDVSGNYLFSVWNSITPSSTIPGNPTDENKGNVADYILAHPEAFYQVVEGHERNKNWQVTTTFAEEGKKKEVASYYDGSLRNRQSVTRVNSDNNIIVGETVYDHQGRPAVNILPVPVQTDDCTTDGENSFKFYPNFNTNSNGDAYNKEDFDIDAAECETPTGPMSNQSGASQYYSPNNPDQATEQGYIPDAVGFPFTKVEYTPDNTGRIRRQSGVGPEFQLGSGHESKYFYGRPDQIQIDRLFGSEVGYAAHYKKNMVIDPNGQVSVSYLDQEGRVIATSLAGDTPDNLMAIESHATSEVTLTENMISTVDDNVTNSGNVNQPNVSQSILVSSAGTYDFVYDLSSDHYTEACLPNICFTCVYDLTISLTDDCGNVVLTDAGDPFIIEKVEGAFTETNGVVVFETDCTNPNYIAVHTFTASLEEGNYNFNKTLTINNDAINFYLDKYLDSTENTCLQTLNDFQEAYLAEIDTMDCYIDCQACFDDLGNIDDFVAAGRGSAADYNDLYAECEDDCSEPTMCEIALDMLLVDVSPEGQYGKTELADGTIAPLLYPLSVFNDNNSFPAAGKNWKNPSRMYNGSLSSVYLNDDESISYVVVTETSPGQYSPAISVAAPILINGQLVVEPYQLLNVTDFLAVWQDSWALSLVRHHPEYCYYESCIGYEEEDANGISSEEFDAKLRSLTFAQAVGEGYLVGNPTSGYSLNLSSDPFTAYTGAANYNAAVSATFTASVGNFQTVNSTSYSMLQIAALINKCGNSQIGNPSFPSDCLIFGQDIAGFTNAENDEVREASWITLVAFYLGKKNEVINDKMDIDAVSNSCFNDCIGDANFSPIGTALHNPLASFGSGTNPAYDLSQPCSYANRLLFKDKVKRFPDITNDLVIDENEIEYQSYAQTGLCPTAQSFQAFVNEIASEGGLLSTSTDLLTIDTYAGLEIALNEGAISGTLSAGTISLVSQTTNQLILSYNSIDIPNCNIEFNSINSIVWPDVVGLSALFNVVTTAGVSTFEIVAEINDGSGSSSTYESLTGSTCLPIGNCSFNQQCETNELGFQLEELINAINSDGNLTTNFTLSSSYDVVLGTQITSLLGSSNLSWNYNVNSGNPIFELSNGTEYIQLNITLANYQSGMSISDISYFTDLTSNYENYFTIEGFDLNSGLVVEMEGNIRFNDGDSFSMLSVGTCGNPISSDCNTTEHQNWEDLQNLFDVNFFSSPNSIDLLSLDNFTTGLSIYIDPSLSATTSSESFTSADGVNTITLIIENGECDFEFIMETGDAVSFSSISSITSISESGTITNNNFYEFIIEATVLDGSDNPVPVSILVNSCIPFKPCAQCVPATSASLSSNLCTSEYNDYLQLVSDYNESIYTSSNGNTIAEIPASDSELFCSCYESYSNYLAPYLIEPTDLTLPAPVSLDNFDCNYGECNQVFADYISTVNNYNATVQAIGLPASITEVVSQEDFLGLELCDCYAGYEAFLNSQFDNNFPNGIPNANQLSILSYCSDLPCTPDFQVQYNFGSTEVPYVNPCVENMINTALSNAENAYNNYTDSLSAAFITNYKEHCNNSLNEGLKKTYPQREHHFTLYYYDQSGNLVKTVPPEGVEPLDITSSFAALAIQIAADRSSTSDHTVFTNHRLATKYHYNSLNQLTKQSLPDHDMMEISDFVLVNGLDSRLEIQRSHFSSSNIGYLVGNKPVTLNNGEVISRGMVYTTTDGGSTWNRLNHTVGSDINNMQWVSTTDAFAVADYGVFLRTLNGGNAWDMVNLYDIKVNENLNDLFLQPNNVGLIVGDNRTIVKYDPVGGINTKITPVVTAGSVAINSNDNITSIDYNDNNLLYYITVNRASGSSMMYSSADGTTWSSIDQVRVSDLSDVHVVNSQTSFAAGNNGVLLTTTNAGTDWVVIDTDLKEQIEEIYFVNSLEGVAIINGALYETFNGGNNWLLTDNSMQYNSLSVYEENQVNNNAKLIAGTSNGYVVKVILQNGAVGIIPISIPTANNASIVDAQATMNGANLTAVAITTGGVIHYTNSLGANFPSWLSQPLAIGTYEELVYAVSGSNYQGIIRGTNGTLTEFNVNGGFTSAALLSGVLFSDIESNLSSAVYGYTSTTNELYTFTLNPSGTLGSSISNPVIGVSGLLKLATSGTEVSLFSNLGDLYQLDNTYAAIDNTLNVRPLTANDVAVASSSVVVVNNSGQTVNYSTGIGVVKASNTTSDLNGITSIGGTSTRIVGDNGIILDWDQSSFNTVVLNTTNNLNQIDYNAICDCEVVAGDNGAKFNRSGSTGAFNSMGGNIIANLKSVGVNDNGIYTIAGEDSKLYWGQGSFMSANKEVFTTGVIYGLDFKTISKGILSGDNYLARHTTDGGLTWDVIAPRQADFTAFDGRLRVAKELDGYSVIAGIRGYYSKVVNNVTAINISNKSFTGTSHIYGVSINDNGVGYMIGGNGSVAGFAGKTSDGGDTWQLIASGLPSFLNFHHFKNNNTFMAVGYSGAIRYYPGSGNNLIVLDDPGTTATLGGIDFYDNSKGYITGLNGILLKSSNVSLNQNLEITGISWETISLADQTGIQNSSVSKNARSINVVNNNKLFLGGRYTPTGLRENYARILTDESGEYSTYFYYDKLGRIVASQNTRQKNELPEKYSYTLYDELGRVVEAGEKSENTSAMDFNSIFGTQVSSYFNPIVIDDVNLNLWIADNTGERREVTHSYYDKTNSLFTYPAGFAQNEANLRKRIGSVTYEELYDGIEETYEYATHYDYDIHGNVKTLVQDNQKLGGNTNPDVAAQQYKTMKYDYDLISGNVHQVGYQDGEADQWHHRYEYDGDNRILDVKTSEDKVLWDDEARYFYYDHGPLSRVELGENNVQGCDYAYTLQGWLKGVNSDLLSASNDIGKDGFDNGSTTSPNPNQYFAKDATGFSLNYYTNDYNPVNTSISSTASFNSSIAGSDVQTNRNDLYNGNIGAMVTTIKEPVLYASTQTNIANIHPQATAYKYDQLNRLLEARAFTNIERDVNNGSYNDWKTGTANADLRYFNAFSYDANGNIETQIRKDIDGNVIDQLNYNYAELAGEKIQNRLYSVNDVVDYDDADIDDMGTFTAAITDVNNGSNNYRYDGIGQLKQDLQEEILDIKWRVDGKIKAIIRIAGSTKQNLIFDYDPMGNRIAKHVYGNTLHPVGQFAFDYTNPDDWKSTTYYGRDAQGNVMAVYEYKVYDDIVDQTDLISDINNVNQITNTDVQQSLLNATPLNEDVLLALINSTRSNSAKNAVLTANSPLSTNVLIQLANNPINSGGLLTDIYTLNAPVCEDALLAVISSQDQNGVINSIMTANAPLSDLVMIALIAKIPPVNNWVVDNMVIANTPLTDNVLLSLLNKIPAYPNSRIKSWMAANNNLSSPVLAALQAKFNNNVYTFVTGAPDQGYLGLPGASAPDNCTPDPVNTASTYGITNFTLAERNIYGSSRVGMNINEVEMIGTVPSVSNHLPSYVGKRQYELSNHLGNVLSVISDRKYAIDLDNDGTVDCYEPDILLTYDYSPFGVILQGRGESFAASDVVPADLHWSFDGGTLAELNGSGYDAQLINGPVQGDDRCQAANNAFVLDGTNDYIRIDDNPDIDFTGQNFTISVLARKDAVSRFGNVVVGQWKNGGQNIGENEWALTLGGGEFGTTGGGFSIEDVNGTSYAAKTTTTPAFGVWYHIVGVRDGDFIKYYVDGVLEGTTAIPSGTIVNNTNVRDLLIGRIDHPFYSNITIDDLQIFKQALDDTEVANLYGSMDCNYIPIVPLAEVEARTFTKDVCRDTVYQIPTLVNAFDFEDGTVQGWFTDPYNTLTNVSGVVKVEKTAPSTPNANSKPKMKYNLNLTAGQTYTLDFEYNTDGLYDDPLNNLGNRGIKVNIKDKTVSPSVTIASSNTLYGNGAYTMTFTANITGLHRIIFTAREQGGPVDLLGYHFEMDNVVINELIATPDVVCVDYSDYRYGFNGMEKDDEVKGAGNSYDYKKRFYDNRLGRFLSIDALKSKYPYYSPYQFAGNQTIVAIDVDGMEPQYVMSLAGKLTEPVISVLNVAFGYDEDWMRATEWSTLGAFQIKARVEDSYRLDIKAETAKQALASPIISAITLGHDIIYEDDMQFDYHITPQNWLGLVAHEHSHGEDYRTQGTYSFLINYIATSTHTDYRQIPTEVKAFRLQGVINGFLKESPGVKMVAILANKELSDDEKIKQVRPYSLLLRKRVIDSEVSILNKDIKKYEELMEGGPSGALDLEYYYYEYQKQTLEWKVAEYEQEKSDIDAGFTDDD